MQSEMQHDAFFLPGDFSLASEEMLLETSLFWHVSI